MMRTPYRRFAVAFTLTLVPAVAPRLHGQAARPASATPPTTLEQGVDSIMGRALGVPVEAISVAIMRGDAVVLATAYGSADRESGRRATPETVFEIGSITKQFTAAAIVKLAEQGRLTLDDTLAEHIPALRERAPGVTLRHLLTHSSGLSRAWVVSDLTAPSSPRLVVDSLAARPVEFAPGERYAYNNNGYILLGLVIEKVSGERYADYLRDSIIEPLGLKSVRRCDEVPADRRAVGYVHPTRGTATPAVAPSHSASVTFAAGMLCSTATDLARWERALATGRVVSAAGWRDMTTPATLASGRTARYGLGVETLQLDSLRYLSHGGATPGFIGEAAYLPDSALAVVVLTNGIYAGDIVSQLTRNVARTALGLPVPTVVDLPLDAAGRAPYTGTFDLGPMKVEVYEQGDHLRAQPEGQLSARLLYQGSGVFQAEHDPSLLFRFTLVGGRAQLLTLEQGGRAMPPAKRVR